MKNKTTQGLGNKRLLSFQKRDSLKYWRLKSDVNSHMSIQYTSHYLDHFRFVRRQIMSQKYICRQHETLDYTLQKIAQAVIICNNWMVSPPPWHKWHWSLMLLCFKICKLNTNDQHSLLTWEFRNCLKIVPVNDRDFIENNFPLAWPRRRRLYVRICVY
jgi:hypothetical protein